MTNATLRGKPDAGNPHVRFDEGEVASAKPRRGSLLYNVGKFSMRMTLLLVAALAFASDVRSEDAYVHSDGTQYLDTGYVIKSNTRVELDMALDAVMTSGDQYLFGTYGDKSGKLAFCSYMPPEGNVWLKGRYSYCCQKDTADWTSTGYSATTERRTLVLDGYHNLFVIVQGGVTNFTKTITGAHSDCDSGVTMPVFAGYNLGQGTYTGKSAFKLYSLKIYESDELVMDFEPCLWCGEIGLRDKISGVLRQPVIGNALTYGGEIHIIDDGYLQSTGDQYIDTGYQASGDTRVELDMAFVDPITAASAYPFGVSAASSGLMYGMYVNPSLYCGWNCADGTANWGSFGCQATARRRTYVVDGFANKYAVIDYGVTNQSGLVSTVHTGTTLYTLPVFGNKANSRNAVTQKTAMKLYGFRIYERDALVRNFVPCVKGGIAGLKETLSGAFYTDRSSSPENRLVAGGDVLREDDEPYVKGDGFQSLDTGVFIDTSMRFELDFAPERTSGTKYLFGSTTAANGKLVFSSYIADGAMTVVCQTNVANWQAVGAVSSARKRLVVDMPNRNIKVYESNVLLHDTSLAGKIGEAGDVYETRCAVPLLGNKLGGSEPSSIAAAKIYGYKVYRGETLLHDFKPYVKDSVVGLRDAVTDAFIASVRKVTGFEAGGNIPANVEEDASLRSSQRQAINTGYLVNADSRIEVDFAFNQHTNALERVFGATACAVYPFGLYANSSDATWGYFCFAAGSGTYNTMVPVDVARHTAIVDMKKKWVLFVTGSTTNYWADIAAAPSGAVWPMALFGEAGDASFTTAQRLSNLRIYSVKISENGQLVHHYLPYKSADQVGLRDVVTGVVKQDVLASGEPFTVGCRGWGEAHAAFYENPEGGAVSSGETKVLSAFAPGAVAYQWLKDGTPIDGATGMTYSVSWQRRAPDADYSVRADFNRYGVKVQSTSDAATIVNRPHGMVILFR